VLLSHDGNHQKSGFIFCLSRDLNSVKIGPQLLGFDKVDTVFFLVSLAFCSSNSNSIEDMSVYSTLQQSCTYSTAVWKSAIAPAAIPIAIADPTW
jgi:hypothetical protein